MSLIALLHTHISEQPTMDQKEAFDVAEIISAELIKLHHKVVQIPFTTNMDLVIEALNQAKPDFVFNLVDDVADDDSLHFFSSALLKRLGYKFTGAPAEIMFITSHKLLTKRLLRMCDIPTPAWVSLEDVHDFVSGQRYITKPVSHDASIGIDENSVSTVDSLDAFLDHLRAKRAQTGWDHFGERFVAGREFWVSMMESNELPIVFPPSEMKFIGYEAGQAPQYVSYRSKWERDSYEYKHLVAKFEVDEQDLELVQRLQDLARACWQTLHLRGYARIDIRVDQHGQPWVLEVNVNPYLPYHYGGFLDAAQHAGWDFGRVLEHILSQAN
jgi:D-alanine-D-alanine ligase